MKVTEKWSTGLSEKEAYEIVNNTHLGTYDRIEIRTYPKSNGTMKYSVIVYRSNYYK